MLDPSMLLHKIDLSTGDQYADFGCGALGHFVFPASEIVGEGGQVFAVDVVKGVLEELEQRIRDESAHNVTPVWGDIERDRGINISPESLDVVSMVNMAAHIDIAPKSFEEARRLLKINGRLLVIDWKPEAGSIVIDAKERTSADSVNAAVTRTGFRLVNEFEAGPQHWGLLFQRVA